MSDIIKNDIYDLLYDITDDNDKITCIYNKIEELEQLKIDEEILNIKKYKETIKELMNDFEKTELKLKSQEKQNKLLKKAIGPLFIFRISLNTILNNMWEKYKLEIENLDYDLLSKQLNRKYTINSDGCRYALARINDKCDGLSKNLCQLYITLNNNFHPKTKPIYMVHECIKDIKILLDEICMPETYLISGINKNIVDDFEEVVNNNKHLF